MKKVYLINCHREFLLIESLDVKAVPAYVKCENLDELISADRAYMALTLKQVDFYKALLSDGEAMLAFNLLDDSITDVETIYSLLCEVKS